MHFALIAGIIPAAFAQENDTGMTSEGGNIGMTQGENMTQAQTDNDDDGGDSEDDKDDEE